VVDYRLRYSKQGELRFISHLDLVRGFERILRRAGLPVAYSEGYNPHPKLGFGPALPLGVESVAEYLDMEFTRSVDLEEIIARLNHVMPPGLRALELVEAARKLKPLTAVINCAVYRYEGLAAGQDDPERIRREVERLWKQDTLLVTRKAKGGGTKNLNVRGFLKNWQWLEQPGSGPVLCLETVIGNQGTIRPDEFLRFFAVPIDTPRIIRTDLWVDDGINRVSPLALCR